MITPPFDTELLCAYLSGDLPDGDARAVHAAAEADPELGAKLACLAALVGATPEPVAPPPRVPTRRRFLSRAAVIGGIAAFAAGGATGYAGFRALRPAPPAAPAPPPREAFLFEDDFADEYLDPDKWDLGRCRKGLREMDGYARLRNRASLVTHRSFDEPFELAFDWTWLDWAEDPLYAEHLNVVLHTTGHHRPVHSFEITDGLVISLNTVAAHVNVGVAEVLPNRPHIRHLKEMPEKTTVFAADKRYHVRITDTGKKVTVFVSGGKIDPNYATTPIVEVEYAETFTEHRIAVYNREFVSGAKHESHIRNFKVRKL